MKKITLALFFILILSACQKKNVPAVRLPQPAPSSSPQTLTDPSANESINAQLALDAAKAKETAQREAAEAENEKDQLEQERKNNKTALDLMAAAEGPRAQMIADLQNATPVPVLIVAYGPSIGKMRMLENEINTARSVSRSTFFSHVENMPHDVSRPLVYSEYFLEVDSAEKFKILLDYSHRLGSQVRMFYFPASEVVLRHFLEFEYRDPNPLKTDPIIKKYWIGDSPPARMNYLPVTLKDFETALPYTTACASFDAECLKSLVAAGFFTDNSTPDEAPATALNTLRQNLHEAVLETDRRGLSTYKNYFSQAVRDVKLTSEVWVVYPDTDDLLDLSNLYGISERAERYGASGAIYQSPLSFHSTTTKFTSDPQLNLSVTVHQLYDYVCKVTTCLERD